MRNGFHPDECGSQRERLGKGYRAPGVGVKTGEGGKELFGEGSGELGLHQCRAADDGYAKAVRRLQQRNAIGSYCLSRKAHGFRHCEIDWKLDDFEMVLLPADFTRHSYELFEAEVVSRFE